MARGAAAAAATWLRLAGRCWRGADSAGIRAHRGPARAAAARPVAVELGIGRASFRPKVVGSRGLPWLRPMVGLLTVRDARRLGQSRSVSRAARRRSLARTRWTMRAGSSTSEEAPLVDVARPRPTISSEMGGKGGRRASLAHDLVDALGVNLAASPFLRTDSALLRRRDQSPPSFEGTCLDLNRCGTWSPPTRWKPWRGGNSAESLAGSRVTRTGRGLADPPRRHNSLRTAKA